LIAWQKHRRKPTRQLTFINRKI